MLGLKLRKPSTMSDNKNLRCITYLSPDIPVEVFETFLHYLEEVTGLDSYLIYESRTKGPPEGKVDPFTSDEVDIGKVLSSLVLNKFQNNTCCLFYNLIS